MLCRYCFQTLLGLEFNGTHQTTINGGNTNTTKRDIEALASMKVPVEASLETTEYMIISFQHNAG